jgi:F0F1-type ATP synthase membrane subunit c/vacuolar-type H+-ATPase subunit K
MKTSLRLKMIVVFLAVLLAALLPAMAQSRPGSNAIESRFAQVEGIKLHYLTAGHGPTVILLHG